MIGAFVVERFLSPSACADIIKLFPPRTPAAVMSRQTDIRKSRTAFLPASAVKTTLITQVRNELVKVNDLHYQFNISGVEAPQLAEYAVGEHYGLHLDIGSGVHALRKLSASVQLSDPKDYDGGDLEIWNTGKAPRTQGTLIVFPSYLVHEVKPVTRGLRRSLVLWATGAMSFR